jgi:hypothetical protein
MLFHFSNAQIAHVLESRAAPIHNFYICISGLSYAVLNDTALEIDATRSEGPPALCFTRRRLNFGEASLTMISFVLQSTLDDRSVETELARPLSMTTRIGSTRKEEYILAGCSRTAAGHILDIPLTSGRPPSEYRFIPEHQRNLD